MPEYFTDGVFFDCIILNQIIINPTNLSETPLTPSQIILPTTISLNSPPFSIPKDNFIPDHSNPRNPPILALELPINQRVLIDHNLAGLELQDHKRRHCIDLKRAVRSSHRPRIKEIHSVRLGGLEIVGMTTDQQLHSHLLRLVAQGLLVPPRNYLVTMDHADTHSTEVEDLCR